MPRAFVLGNGPSLAWTPLEKLSGEVTFAMGRINLIYPTTRWRPTYFVCMDFTGKDWVEDAVTNITAAKHSFVRADRANEIELRREFEWPSRVSYFWHCREHLGCNWESAHRPEAWHLPKLCPYGSTLGMAIQLACVLGYGPIYVLGCDLGWPAHFHPDYAGYDDQPGGRDETLRHMHGIAEKSSPVKIYNATLGGALAEHERVDLTDVIR